MLAEEIKNIIEGEVFTNEVALAKYSQDASLFNIKPQVVVYPKNVSDIKALVKWAAAKRASGENVSLTARAGGSDMTGGPLSESVVLDLTKHFNHIKEVGQDWAVVEPGVYYRDFEKETLKHGLLLPSFPASRELAAIGGIVANNSGGEKTLAYGKTERYVESLKVVLSDGNEYDIKPLSVDELKDKIKGKTFEAKLYKEIYDLIENNYDELKKAKPTVSKNSSGYYLWNVWDRQTFDLTKLFVGSQGTLGIITEVRFKLIKPKSHSKLLIIFLNDLKNLGEIVNTVLKHGPETFESYDKHTLKLAIKFIPDFIKRLGGNVFSLGYKFLPEIFMVLTGGLPQLVLTAEFTGDSAAEAAAAAQAAQKDLLKFKVKTRLTRDSIEADKYRLIRRESFNLLRHKVKGKKTAPFIDDIIVRPEFLPEFLPKLEALLNDYPELLYTVAGHVGDGNFHIIPLVDLSDPVVQRDIPEVAQKVYDLVFRYGGSMSAEHNDGLVRGPFLRQMFGDKIYALFKQTKKIFDPLNIFNPGKKVGVSMDYLIAHLKKG